MKPETIRNKLKRLATDSLTKPTGEIHTCAKCDRVVSVGRDMDWVDGDWCSQCWQDWGQNVRPLLRAMFGIEP